MAVNTTTPLHCQIPKHDRVNQSQELGHGPPPAWLGWGPATPTSLHPARLGPGHTSFPCLASLGLGHAPFPCMAGPPCASPNGAGPHTLPPHHLPSWCWATPTFLLLRSGPGNVQPSCSHLQGEVKLPSLVQLDQAGLLIPHPCAPGWGPTALAPSTGLGPARSRTRRDQALPFQPPGQKG